MVVKDILLKHAFFIFLQAVVYFGSEFFQKDFNNVEREWDKEVPVVAEMILIYILWFPLILLFPISLFYADQALYNKYLYSWLAVVLISVIIYIFYPTTFTRPENFDDIRNGWMLNILYKFNYKGVNCMPSLHCSLSFIIFLYALMCVNMPFYLKAAYAALANLIIISTQYTKQHVLIDAVTGIILGALCTFFPIFLLK